MQWLLTLTYIFKVFRPWLCNKTAKIWHIFSCPLYSMCSSYGFFSYLAQMITSFRGSVTCNDLWSWALSSRSFSHNFAIKLLRYGTSLMPALQHVQFCIKIWSYLAQMITTMRVCVACNDLRPWLISSKLFSCDVAYFMYYIDFWQKYNPWEDHEPCTVSGPIGQRSHRSFTLLQWRGWVGNCFAWCPVWCVISLSTLR